MISNLLTKNYSSHQIHEFSLHVTALINHIVWAQINLTKIKEMLAKPRVYYYLSFFLWVFKSGNPVLLVFGLPYLGLGSPFRKHKLIMDHLEQGPRAKRKNNWAKGPVICVIRPL